MNINAIIIDDERRSRAFLSSLINAGIEEVQVIGEASDIPTGIQQIKDLDPDLIFLDIQLKDGTGFDILNQFSKYNFKVIFITAYDQYAIDAFKVYAVDYLLKPIDKEALSRATKKALKEIRLDQKADQIDQLISYLKKDQDQIIISTENAYDFIQLKNILRLQADGSYTKIFLKDGTLRITSKGLKEYELTLKDRGFFRVHQSHLISMNEVKSISKSISGEVTLSDGSILPISRRRKEAFLMALKLFK